VVEWWKDGGRRRQNTEVRSRETEVSMTVAGYSILDSGCERIGKKNTEDRRKAAPEEGGKRWRAGQRIAQNTALELVEFGYTQRTK
jgi:hypothetical protein